MPQACERPETARWREATACVWGPRFVKRTGGRQAGMTKGCRKAPTSGSIGRLSWRLSHSRLKWKNDMTCSQTSEPEFLFSGRRPVSVHGEYLDDAAHSGIKTVLHRASTCPTRSHGGHAAFRGQDTRSAAYQIQVSPVFGPLMLVQVQSASTVCARCCSNPSV